MTYPACPEYDWTGSASTRLRNGLHAATMLVVLVFYVAALVAVAVIVIPCSMIRGR